MSTSDDNEGGSASLFMDGGAFDAAMRLFDAIFAGQEGGLGIFTGKRNPDTGRITSPSDRVFAWPAQRADLLRHLESSDRNEREIWFCGHLLTGRRRKENALPLAALYADIDHDQLPPEAPVPTAIIESSPGRWQGLWRLDQPLRPELALTMNQRLAAAIGADPSGSDLSPLLRVPGSRNHKYPEQPVVRLLALNDRQYSHAELKQQLPAHPSATGTTAPAQRFDTAEALRGVPEGRRDETLFKLACKLRTADVPQDLAETLVLQAAANCDPPFDAAEAIQKVQRAYTTYTPHGHQPSPPRLPPVGPREAGIRGDALLLRQFPEPRWVVPGLLPEGLTALAGAPKMGKSWLALDLAIGVATGRAVLAQTPERGEVLALFLEDNQRRLQSRTAKLLMPDQLPAVPQPGRATEQESTIWLPFNLADLPPASALAPVAFHTHWPRLDQGEPTGLDQLDEWLTNHPATRLVIIDTFTRVRPRAGRSSAYEEDANALGPLQRLALGHRVAILILTHLRKQPGDDPLEQVNASMGFTATLDAIWILKRVRGQADAALFVTGRDIEDERELALSWDKQTARWSASGEAAEARLSDERAAVLRVLREGGGVMSAQTVADLLSKPRGTVKRLLWELSNDGLAESTTKGYRVVGRAGAGTNQPNHPNHTNQGEPYEPLGGSSLPPDGSGSGSGGSGGVDGSGGSDGAPATGPRRGSIFDRPSEQR